MKFEVNQIGYLRGLNFSNSLQLIIAVRGEKIINRFEFIAEKVKSLNVIDVGCCDHNPLIDKKIVDGNWLHGIIEKKSAKCIGVDINKEGIDYLKYRYKINDIICADIINDFIPEIEGNTWDIIILGEVLEHIDNPTAFLSMLHKKYKGKIKNILITVPNALSYSNYRYANNCKEVINSDHYYWFSPYTLAKILTTAGFEVKEFCFSQEINIKIGLKAKLKVFPYLKRKMLYSKLTNNPALRDTLIMMAEFNG